VITNCPVCGKGFDVLWPHLWRYKRGKSYLCSWKCLRLADSKGKEEVMNKTAKRSRMNAVEMDEAIRLFREGDSSLDQYLTDHGITNIPKWKANTKQRYGVPKEPTLGEAMTGMKDAADEFFGKCEAMGLKLDSEPQSPVPVPPPIEYRVTGISTAIGDFQYFKKSGYIDWTPLDGNGTVSMNLEEWKELMKIWPFVLKVLEVEL
jgi:hypothetical protein